MIVFDTETSGFPKGPDAPMNEQPKIIEFVAIKLNDETLEEEGRIEFLAHPEMPIPEKITEITGLTNEHFSEAKPFSHYYEDLAKFFEGQELVVAHNLDFDKKMMNIEIKRSEKPFPWPKKEFCSMLRTTNVCNIIDQRGRVKWPKLSELYFFLFQENFEGAHRAMADVEALVRILRELKVRGIFQTN